MYRIRKKFLPGCDNTIAISFHAFSFLCTSLYFGSLRSYSSGYFRTSSINFSFCMIFEKSPCTANVHSVLRFYSEWWRAGGRHGADGWAGKWLPVTRQSQTHSRYVDNVWSLRGRRMVIAWQTCRGWPLVYDA